VVLGSRDRLDRDGVSWVSPDFSDLVPSISALPGTAALCGVLSATAGAWRAWIAGGVIAARVVLHTGHRYRQEVDDAG
jgi:hypothetical protein